MLDSLEESTRFLQRRHMKLIQRVIYTGFAAIAITSASMPVWPAYTNDDAERDAIEAAPAAQADPALDAFERR